MSKIMAAVAVSALLATPAIALAARYHPHHAYAQAPTDAGDEAHMNPARMKALKECTAMEQKYNNVSWGDVEVDLYRSCMAEHHQAE